MIDPDVTARVEAAIGELVPPRGQNETRSLALAGGRVLRRLPSALDDLTDASAAASVKTAALVGGPEALRLLARWAPDPRGAVQRALTQVWRYFDPADYAHAVLRDAPLDHGKIEVTLLDHIPHLRTLHHLQDAQLTLVETDTVVDDLTFLRDAPPATTWLDVMVSGPANLSPLANCPALHTVCVRGGTVSTGLEIFGTLRELKVLNIRPPDGGQDLSFMTNCPALTDLILVDCTELSDLSALAPASHLRNVLLFGAKNLRDLSSIAELLNLRFLSIHNAPLSGGLAALAPIVGRLKALWVQGVATVTSLDTLTGSALDFLDLGECPITNLEPLGTLKSLTCVLLRRLPNLDLEPLASLPHLRELKLWHMSEPVNLSPLAQIEHRLRVELLNTPTVGEPGPLVKVRRR